MTKENEMNTYERTDASTRRVMGGLGRGEYREHKLLNGAVPPYACQEVDHLRSYSCFIRSGNAQIVFNARGIQSEQH